MHNFSNAEDNIFFKERGFGKSLGLNGNLSFVVVDIINGFTDSNMPMGSDLSQQIQHINKFLETSRIHSIPVIFTSIAYEETKPQDSGLWAEKMQGLKTLVAGTEAVKIDKRLEYRKGDTILTKKYASAFFGTDLSSRLTASKIDTVVIAGATTSGCVRATAVDAIQLGFRPVVLSDSCGDRSEASHNQSLFDLEQKYADVMTTQEAIQAIDQIFTMSGGNLKNE